MSPSERSEDLRYIIIEGVIGAGKTTLARLLSDEFESRLVLEKFEENPFLERFYEDRKRWGFQTQLAFLSSRFKQQKKLRDRDLFQQMVISDYAFDKDRIFAHQNLSGDELQLYETMYNLMEPNTPKPDLVVYLQSSPERLMRNIKQRGRHYERDMDFDYIKELHEAYNYYFFRYQKSPLLIIKADEIDFVENKDDLSELQKQIIHTRHEGMTYFNPPVPSTPEES